MTPFRRAALSAFALPILAGALVAAPNASASAADYDAAIDSGFGQLNSFSDVLLDDRKTRGEWNIGPNSTTDDGVIVTKFFIPNAKAATGLLRGDDRNFSNSPVNTNSRAWIVWDLRSGRVSLTMSPSDNRWTSERVSALFVEKKSSASQVTSSGEVSVRFTNQAFARRTASGGLEFKASLMNSVTNDIALGAWSADFTGTITPRNLGPGPAGGYRVQLVGNGYPAVESYYYPRAAAGRDRLFLRRVDPDKLLSTGPSTLDSGGGVGAVDRASWFDCTDTPGGGSFCDAKVYGTIFGIWGRATPDDYSTLLTSNAG